MGKLARFIYYHTGNSENDAPDTEHTASGAVVHFTTKESAPVTSLTAAINPVQDLNGYDVPWAAGNGRNKYSGGAVEIGRDGGASKSQAIETLPAGTYYISCTRMTTAATYGLQFLHDSTTILSIDGIYLSNTGTSFTLTESADEIYVYMSDTDYANGAILWLTNIQIEVGTSKTSYVPYSNVCPITGWTGANVHVSSAQGQDGTVYSVEWQTEAGTVYGGTVDVTTGVLTVTQANITSYDGETLSGVWISSMDVYAEGSTPTTGAQVVYELAEPLTYELAPSEVQTLVGENFIWADTGDVTVTYKGTPST